MKLHLMLMALCLLTVPAFAKDAPAASATTTEPAAKTADATTEKTATSTESNNYVVEIKGMHCKSCADGVKKSLGALPMIEKDSVKIELKKNTATIKIKKGQQIDEALIRKTIEDDGYSVTKIETI